MGYFNSLDNLNDQPEEMIPARFSTIEYTHDSFLEKISEFSDAKIRYEIKIGDYFNYDHFSDPNTRVIFQKLWTNKTFLNNVLFLISEDQDFRDKIISTYITTVNKLAFDYILFPENEKDIEVQNLLTEIAKHTDYAYVLKLCTIMPLDMARMIAMARFSDFNLREAINRFNNIICKGGVDFTEQDIIYIYSVFFSESYTDLFNITMTSVEEVFEKRIYKKVYDMMSLALLDILESMTTEDIYKVLHSYGNYIELMNTCNCRFSMRSLSDDYNRINSVINELLDKGISIP